MIFQKRLEQGLLLLRENRIFLYEKKLELRKDE